jgi:hypothetical protein
MRLETETEQLQVATDIPPRRESAALRLLASGDLGAHLLRLAEGAAREHVAQTAHKAPAASGGCPWPGGEP